MSRSRMLWATPGALITAALGVLVSGCGPGSPISVAPTSHDFGTVMHGESRRHEFTLRNDGNRTVNVNIKPNCSCFSVAQRLAPLDPGRTQTFTVTFSTAKLSPQKLKGKWMTIVTDHPDQEPIIVQLTGEVFRAYDLRPSLFNMGRIDGRPANYEPHKVTVRPVSGRQVLFKGSYAMPQDVFDVTTHPFGDDGSFEVHLTLRKDARRPVGAFSAQVRMDLEVTAPDDTVRVHRPTVNLRGFWSLEK